MDLCKIREEIDTIEKRMTSIKIRQKSARRQLKILKKRLHFLHTYENQCEEYSAGIN